MEEQLRELKKQINLSKLFVSLLESLGDTPAVVEEKMMMVQKIQELETSKTAMAEQLTMQTVLFRTTDQSITSSSSNQIAETKSSIEVDFNTWILQAVILEETKFLEQLYLAVTYPFSTDQIDRMVSLRKQFILDDTSFGTPAAIAFLQISIYVNTSLSQERKLFILKSLPNNKS
jgi:hypothetical protein